MGMMPVHGLIALVVATAFLMWVHEKNGNPMQKLGKFVAWVAVIISAVMLIGQIFMCTKMCASGQCMRMMGKPGMGMGGGMMQQPPMDMPGIPGTPGTPQGK